MSEKLVIIGSGMATAKLLEALVARGSRYTVTVIGEEQQPSYNRILLSSILCGDKTEQDACLLDKPWYQAQGVRLHTGDRAISVDLAGKTVATEQGEIFPYDRLVFATGSTAHIPTIPGADAVGVMGFRSLADLAQIRLNAKRGGKALVVGGGLLGLEAAHGLNALGMDVTVIHRNRYPMNRQLDDEAGALLQQQLERRGIAFAMNVSPQSLSVDNGAVTGMALSNGANLDADLVLFAAGIDPRMELAQAAGIACKRAIVADRFMQTSADNVYALGECCEIDGRTFGLVAPVYEQAECLADKLCHRPTAGYTYVETPTQLKVSGIDLYSAGELPFGADTSSQYLRNPARGIYRRLIFKGDQLVGAVLLGDRTGGVWYGELIQSGASVREERSWLMFGTAFREAG